MLDAHTVAYQTKNGEFICAQHAQNEYGAQVNAYIQKHREKKGGNLMVFDIGQRVRWTRPDGFTFPPERLSGTIGIVVEQLVEGTDFDAEVGQMYTVWFSKHDEIHAFEYEMETV